MKQYSKRMVIVHWLTLALLIAAWFLGDSLAEATDNSKATLAGYIVHMLVGGAILLITMTRLVFRSKDGTPPAIGQSAVDKLESFMLCSLPIWVSKYYVLTQIKP